MSTQSPTTSFTPFNGQSGQARSFQERRAESHIRQNEGTLSAVQYLKMVLRVVGAMVSFLFLIQEGVLVFIGQDFSHPKFHDVCRLISQALLGVLIGLAGMYLEIRGSMSSVASNLMKHALNRCVVAVFYFWMGCYIAGKEYDDWKVIFQGIATVGAWLVAIGDLIVVCAPSERQEEDMEAAMGHVGTASRGSASQARRSAAGANELQAASPAKLLPEPATKRSSNGFPETQQWATGPAVSAAPAAAVAVEDDNPFGGQEDNPFGSDPDSSGATANFGGTTPKSGPQGGGEWNSAAFGRSFGSS